MIALLQRVSEARVQVRGETIGASVTGTTGYKEVTR